MKSVIKNKYLDPRVLMLTFVSGNKVLYVFGNVLVEMQLPNVQWFDHCTLV